MASVERRVKNMWKNFIAVLIGITIVGVADYTIERIFSSSDTKTVNLWPLEVVVLLLIAAACVREHIVNGAKHNGSFGRDAMILLGSLLASCVIYVGFVFALKQLSVQDRPVPPVYGAETKK